MRFSKLVTLVCCAVLVSACANFASTIRNEPEPHETETLSNELETETNEIESTNTEPAVSPTSETKVFGRSARDHLEVLAGDIGDRLAGSGNETLAAEYIQGVFEEIGYTTEIQYFSAFDYDYEASFTSTNIIAVKKGFSNQQIILGAHYDSVEDDGSQGADDNASGVAVLLEAAERVFDMETPYTIVFAAFGAEEEGLWGSENYVDQLNGFERKNIIGMVNLDCLIAGDKTYVYGNEGPGSMRDWLLEDAKQQGLKIEGKTDEDMFNEDGTPCECSDYDAFEKSNIPYAYFEATNWDLSPDGMVQVDPQYGIDGEIRHTEFDTIEYIDKTFPGRIDDHLKVFVTLLYDLVTQY
ncbi:MAG: Zn-dependent exopeptidase M28 [Anaerolinea sp.]|nr:Zn-dependent exopeptidase M28 [Anaerolinea sp.]